MAAVSQKIPNLLGGVSQQPDPVKLPGQVREAINTYLDPTFGCRKRPGTDYIATIAEDLPTNAKWFPIFRDNNERYAVAMYANPSLTVRVWDLNDGQERTVTMSPESTSYFDGANAATLETLTIADYTLITNPARTVTMGTNTTAAAAKQGLVIVDQVAYNTTYNVDFQKDGDTAPSVVYKAAGVEVIPGSYERQDEGVCTDVASESFTVNSGSKTGLSFRITNQCAAYLDSTPQKRYKADESTDVVEFRVNPAWDTTATEETTQIEEYEGNLDVIWTWYPTVYELDAQGQPTEEVISYGYWTPVRPETEDGINYSYSDFGWEMANSLEGVWRNGDSGGQIRLKDYQTEEGDPLQQYVSKYTVDIDFLNGGAGWRAGDTVVVTMSGVNFTVRVTKDSYEYAYNSLGTATYTTPPDTESGPLSIGEVVSNLNTAINALTGISSEFAGYVLKASSTNGRDFNISTRGGTTNKALDSIKGIATDVAQLPSQGFDGYIIKVANTDDTNADDYYVRFTTEAPGIPGAGSWVETVAPGIKTTINSSTMPQALIRQANGTFTVGPLDTGSAFGGWADRVVGDTGTNPEPSFVGRGIANMFYYANRLGFLSEDAVIMSQPGDYFNFFSTSALALSDADPIDLTASSTSPAILKSAIGSPKGLILFAERSQFLVSTSELVFSSSTVKLSEISNYFYRSAVPPLNGGSSLAFLSENRSYTKVLEMATDSVENRPVVADITQNVPEYLPSSLAWGEAVSNNSIYAFGDNSSNVYLFKYYNNGDTRELAGWSTWTFPAPVRMFASEDDLLHIILDDGEKTIYCRAMLVDDPSSAPMDVGFSKFTPRVDLTLDPSQVTTAPAGEQTTNITIAADRYYSNVQYILFVTEGDYKGTFIKPTVTSNADGSGVMEVSSNLLTTSYIIGCDYNYRVELPAIFVKQENVADRTNIPMVSFVHLDLYFSGSYTVTLEKLGYPTKTRTIEQTFANVYDANSSAATEINQYTVPVFAPGNDVKLTIEGTGPYPSAITSYSWDGSYNNRGVNTLR